MSIIEVVSLYMTYRTGTEEVKVLQGIKLSLEEGETTVITGESGSGKSTLLNLLGGLDRATSGNIYFRGTDIVGKSEAELTLYRSSSLGFIFQFHYLLKDFTALENVMLPALIEGKTQRDARDKAEGLLNRVDLLKRKTHYPVELSGGERQRIAVVRSLMNDPELILADEPTGNLDEKNSEQVKKILFELVSEYNKTMLLVTHDSELAKRGDYHFYLEHGKLKRK